MQGGRIKELIYGANVLGLIMMGALSASYVKITTPLKISALKGSEVVVQQILDSIGAWPAAAGGSICHLYLSGEERAALYHHSAVDCGA
ncbi:PTS system, mannose/fructose/sorbose family, IID component [Citrobacter koseri]|uniref:PTS system, mannose/fructose/sorbose family, IID component n=1 Tax=Citrobacter koseri TaxID=545 RepID=A0A2X2YS91_CITKO|nr:PTS system, mannose/fructose/sorbose family, IID component [Citrobacter koseri]